MRAQQAKTLYCDSGGHNPRQRRVLLVGGEASARADIKYQVFCRRNFDIVGQCSDFEDALAYLHSEMIDLILVSLEFSREDLLRFAFEAKKQHFSGLVVQELSRADFMHLEKLNRNNKKQASHTEKHYTFTAKERSVLMRVSQGWTNQQIAYGLNCSEGSIKAILQQLFRKLGVKNQAQIVRVAFEMSLVANARTCTSEIHQSEPNIIKRVPEETDLSFNDPIEVGDFKIDFSSYRVLARGKTVRLTPLEFRLFACLSKYPNKLLGHAFLRKVIWKGTPASKESLRVLIQSIRAKIETTNPPQYIVTERHLGYRFVPLQEPVAYAATASAW